MEDIKEQIEEITKKLQASETKKKEIEDDIRKMKNKVGRLNAQLNAKLNLHSGEFYIKFHNDGMPLLVIVYINSITKDGGLDATMYRFFDEGINIVTSIIDAVDLEGTRFIHHSEWGNYFAPIILNPYKNLGKVVECIKKAYEKDDVYKLECFGTGKDSVRRGINPYTLEELLTRQGYSPSKKVV